MTGKRLFAHGVPGAEQTTSLPACICKSDGSRQDASMSQPFFGIVRG